MDRPPLSSLPSVSFASSHTTEESCDSTASVGLGHDSKQLLDAIRPTIRGHLRRRGRFTKAWKPSADFYELRSTVLLVYKAGVSISGLFRHHRWHTCYDLAGSAKAGVHSEEVLSGKRRLYPFSVEGVRNSQTVTLHLAAESEQHRTEWLRALSAACQTATRDSFSLRSIIGEGHFGKVLLGAKHSSHKVQQSSAEQPAESELVAIKEVSLTKSSNLRSVLNERQILATLPAHPFVISLQSAFRHHNHLYYVFDFMSGGDLFEHMRKRDIQVTRPVAVFYAAEVLLALQHLHRHGIVYRDLKPENVFVSSSGHLRLGDMGLSKRLAPGERTYSICGTRAYLAPETLRKQGYGMSVDYWQFAAFLYELYCGQSPFYTPRSKNGGRDTSALILAGEFHMPSRLDADTQDIIKKLLQIDPTVRLGHSKGWSEVMQHPFFSNMDFAQLLLKRIEPPIKPGDPGQKGVANFSAQYTTQAPTWGSRSGPWGQHLEDVTTPRLFETELLGFTWSREAADSTDKSARRTRRPSV